MLFLLSKSTSTDVLYRIEARVLIKKKTQKTTKHVIINIFIISTFLSPQNVINCHILQILTGEKSALGCVCVSVNESNMGPFTPFSPKNSRDYVTIRSGHMINSTDEKCKNFDTHFMNFNFMNVTAWKMMGF